MPAPCAVLPRKRRYACLPALTVRAPRTCRAWQELVLHTKREAEGQAAERVRRTSVGAPEAAAAAAAAASSGQLYGGERLYQAGKQQQARLERQSIEAKQQRVDEELRVSTFSPQLSSKAARLRTDGRPVEERMMEWHEARQAKISDAAAASATALHAAPSAAAERRARRSVGDPAYHGGKMRTVDDL